jgi:hypothetical protein
MAKHFGVGSFDTVQAIQYLNPDLASRQRGLPKRPLNSWMAFRSECGSSLSTPSLLTLLAFYTRIFHSIHQKTASAHLTQLWQQDPFKAKWTIVARGYSAIRDYVGKSRAPLGVFLQLVCPAIGIIRVEDYLEKMQWSMQYASDGTINLQQTSSPDLNSFEQHIMHTSMTEKDVIHLVAVHGYITQDVANMIAGRSGVFTVQSQVPQQGLLAVRPTVSQASCPRTTTISQPKILESPPDTPSCILKREYGHIFEAANLRDLQIFQQLWTGSMSDLYNPTAGSFDFASIVDNTKTGVWGSSNVPEPSSHQGDFGSLQLNCYAANYGKILVLCSCFY